MTDRELEQRLRAWYAAEVGERETAPADLRESIASIPVTTPTPLRPLTRRRGFTLLAVAAVLVVGGGLAAGSQLLRLTAVVTPAPSLEAVIATSTPVPSDTPVPTARLRPGALIAYIRTVDKPRACRRTPTCPTPRVWVIGSDGRGAHELFPDGMAFQDGPLTWSPDGARLLYSEDGKLYLTDASGSEPQPVNTGCVAPCDGDSQVAISSDGIRIVFVRGSTDAAGYSGQSVIVTMDLVTGLVAQLIVTAPEGGQGPSWAPDGKRIVFSRFGEKDGGGPVPPIKDSVFVVDADGQNLHQISPATLAARSAGWSPDGSRIVFTSSEADHGDIYTVRPDGSDVRRLTTDGISNDAAWTADGRILFTRRSTGGAVSFWTMDADGTNAAVLVPEAALGVAADDPWSTRPAWQPAGGPAVEPLPWTPLPGIAVGPPAPTPSPTPTPALAPGYSWTGSATIKEDGPLGETATLLADGRVLFTAGCSTAAERYDPVTGTFSPTGSLTQVRGGKTATLLRDGRVLFTGGYNCGPGGDGIWASAELYDPTSGTFSPTGSMRTPREFHTATLLTDGRVLIAGGYTANRAAAGSSITFASYQTAESSSSVLDSAEVYDPATGTFSRTDSMSTFRDHHTATLLQDGRVLVVGGGGEGYASSTSADVYDPLTGTFSKTGSMKTGRWLHTATLLQDGRVLILGGRSPKDSVHSSAELYDARSGKFSSAGSMSEGRQQHTATRLLDGRVLIVAGYWSDGQKWRVLSATEMYDPVTGNFSPIGSIGTPREGHTAMLLNDGRVLIAGGADISNKGGAGVSSAVLYQP